MCRKGRLFAPFSLGVVPVCPTCGETLGQQDVGDGASVLMIFFLGLTLVPLALVFEHVAAPPLWVHAVLFGSIALGLIALVLPAVKAYIILLEYRHRK